MPYIKKEDRIKLNKSNISNNPGELNFQITMLINSYLKRKGVSYTNLNEVIGVLECAKLEIYRRLAAKYEDKKISENGDVYSLDI
ncbi:MAG: hypothetical protein VX770_02840 [Candidatus Neomarinimicrobiota bacterium]|jgi:broad-specificity NMP kinase|nr:hypothetical protein [Candidatus Neomarinimicrobiota bacterium]|tara:strand:- start:276 stop:530 length:255 start_codon:yes stop_codon:yes gene_type:complete